MHALWIACIAWSLGPSWKTDSATVILHRAAGMVAPENSWPALLEAVRQGADGVEIDVRRLADGTLVLHHDDWLPATPYGPGRSPESLPAPFAKAIEVGRRWGSRWADEPMPELEPVLRFALRHGLRLFLDLKTPNIAGEVETLVDRVGARSLVLAVGGTGRFDGLEPVRWVRGWNYTDGGEEDPLRMASVVRSADPDSAFMVDDARGIVLALGRTPAKRPVDPPRRPRRPDPPEAPRLPSELTGQNGWILTLRPRDLSTEALVRLAEDHPDPQVRLDAIMALGNGGHTGAIPFLERWFDRPDPENPSRDPIGRPYYNTYLRATVACALAAMPGKDSRRALDRLARSPRAFAREAVATGLAARGRAEDLGTLAGLVRAHPETAKFALSFVGRFDGRALPVLLAALRAPGQDRRQAVFQIAQLEEAAQERVASELRRSSGEARRSLAWCLYWMTSPRAAAARRRLSQDGSLPADVRAILAHPRPWNEPSR